jgi:uncharacterized protein (DUF1684 family)
MTMDSLQDFRKMKDDYFANDGGSPLTYAQKKKFKGLKYFSPNPALDLEVTVEEFPEKQRIEMQTTTGDIQIYERYGLFHFSVDAKDSELTIYRSPDGFFLPFVDSLASKETYPAGRYLEPEPLGNNCFHVDFNLAYNPYCAYNEYWSCPLTPFENRLKVPIRAGEKLFNL